MAAGLCLLLLTWASGSVRAAGATEKIPGPIFDVRQFGATGNGQTLDTPAINRAIETCAHSGGGTVLFPAGEYVTGTFELLSHVTLQLESGAVIKGSTNLADCRSVKPSTAR
jgi:polygalacturonase